MSAKKSKGFTDDERAAMKERAQELKAQARRGPRADKADGESDVLAKIAEMPQPDRTMAERLHEIIKASAPDLSPKLWYGMPGYAKDGKVVCFFQSAQKFNADALLFGRRTYEIFAGYWGAMANPDNPISDALNTKPKYVASTTLTDPEWADTTVLSGDVAAAIGELKAKQEGELQVHGSGALIRWLLNNQLVDEMNLFVFPVILGQGTRLFPDAGPDVALDLVESRSTPKGVTIQVYRPNGRPRYETADS